MPSFSILLVFCISPLVLAGKDSFHEELFLKPLYSNNIYAYFHFVTIWDVRPGSEEFHHFHLFPRTVGEVIEQLNVAELHVSLTSGLWRYENWGYPVLDAAPGLEIWAWFKPDTADVDHNWRNLVNSLSGLLCASMNFIEPSNSISPEYSFRPKGASSERRLNSTFLRYSALPRETVCTENLTPWKKLLPCESRRGIASLLNSGAIHNTKYHSLSLDFRQICSSPVCSSVSIELRQSVSLVYDYLILGSRDWSFRKLFGTGLTGSCPLSTSSSVFVDVTSNASLPFSMTPAPKEVLTSSRGGQITTLAKYDLSGMPKNKLFNVAVYYPKTVLSVNSPPYLHANQYITGFGQEYGGIATKVYNNFWSDLDVVVLSSYPWFIPIYLHTLKVEANGREIKPVVRRYIPGKQRARPYSVELLLRLPARSITLISVDFDYVFLKWQEYPPDANHGFYVGSAVVTANLPLAKNYTGLPIDGSTFASSLNASRPNYLVQVRTETLIVTLPTPDFSMPYNVICLACTVVALAFGPLHNITSKRLVLQVVDKRNLATRLADFVKARLGKQKAE